MALIDNKITNADYEAKDISSLSDTPSKDGMSASQLKERFDTISKTIIAPKFNDLIDDLVVEFDAKAPTVHTHDDRYYTETETDSLLSGKSDTSHLHDERYYTETETNALLSNKANSVHTHIKSQITDFEHTHLIGDVTNLQTSLDGKAPTVHNHTKSQITDFAHEHDDRYYTETETDTLLSGKSATSHLHDDRYYTETETDTLLNAKAPTVHAHAISDVTSLQTNLDTKTNKLYATNLVVNGDIPIVSSVYSVNAYGVNYILGNKYYVAYEQQISGTVFTASYGANRIIFTSGTVMLSNNLVALQTNNFVRYSGVITALNSEYKEIVFYQTSTFPSTHTLKNALIINLTTLFGAGKERTKEQMDVLVAKFENSHFNGTVEFVDWLKMIIAVDEKANAVHTHAIADTTGLQTALDGKAPTSHTHTIANVTSLQTTLDGKAPTSHTHTIANVTNLQTTLDGKASTVHTHAISDTTGLQTALDGKSATGHTHTKSSITDFAHTHVKADITDFAHTHPISEVTNLQTTLDGKSATGHTHDERYFTESEVTTLLSGKSNNLTFVEGSNITINRTGDNVTINASGTVSINASGVAVADAGNYFTGTDAEAVLQEVGVALAGKASSSHTHTKSQITDFAHNHDDLYFTEAEVTSLLSGKANSSHTHTIANVTSLQTTLDGKAPTVHTHAIADTTGLQNALDGKSATSHLHDERYYTETEIDTLLGGKAPTSHTHTKANITDFAHTHAIADTTGLQTALDGKISLDGSSPRMTGILRGQLSLGAIAVANEGNPSFEVYSEGANSAYMSFHRSGAYAVRFGLDTDNQLKIGGWSMGAVAHTLWHSGNFATHSAGNGFATSSGAFNGSTARTWTIGGGTGITINADDVALTSITSGSGTVGALRYNGTSRLAGTLYGGTTVPSSTTQLNYDGIFYAQGLRFGASGSSSYSDLNMKKEIKDLINSFDLIMSLKPKQFKFKSEFDVDREDDIEKTNSAKSKLRDNIHYGFIAQDVEKTLDKLNIKKLAFVKTPSDDNEFYSLDYTQLIAPIVAVIQKQQSEIEELKAKLNAIIK